MTSPAGKRRPPSIYLAANAVFAGVSDAGFVALDAATTWVLLPGGATLFDEGDAPDALYLVVRGTLHVLVHGTGGDVHSVVDLGPGALVGELGALLDEPRSSMLRAARDAELIRIPRETFLALLETEPALGAAVSRLLGQRLKRTTKQPRVRPRVRTVALVPLDGRPIPPGFAESFIGALVRGGATTAHLTGAWIDREMGEGTSSARRGEPGDSRILQLSDNLEHEYSLVIYESAAMDGPWAERCLRQADLVLVVADSAGEPAHGALERRALEGRPAGSIELVLLHDGDKPPSRTIDWLRSRPGIGCHHVYPGDPEGYERLARFVAGTACGLVLSGGGARGFAHIGVIKALQESAIAVDVIGGSSMGAIIAAQYAAGFDIPTMIAMNRRGFSGSDLSDITIPSVALRKARSTVRKLRAMFGDRQIEDLPRRYFCVSSDLTHATVCVHDQGPLWLWTRASCSIPGLAPPVPSEGRLLVDGGLLNNLPADIMRQRCSGAVIAVNVTPTVDLATDTPLVAEMSGWPHLWRMMVKRPEHRPFPSLAQILSRTVFVASVRDAQAQAKHCDLYLDPPLDGVGMADFRAIDRIVEEGYRHAIDRIAGWAGRPAAALQSHPK